MAELARAVAAEHGNLGKLKDMRPATVHDVLMRCDAIRRPERFGAICLMPARPTNRRAARWDCRKARANRSRRGGCDGALAAMQSVDASAIARRRTQASRERIAAEVRDAASQRFAIGATLLRSAGGSLGHYWLLMSKSAQRGLGLNWRKVDYCPDEPNGMRVSLKS